MTLRIIDSAAPFDFIAKNGYYQIGDAISVHSGPAYQESSRTKLPIKWHFNDEVYSKFNWRSRLNLPITELYRIRAQQIRDQYDYLILWFSGGADSTTILESFLHNNIHLDEIAIVWPVSQTVGKFKISTDKDASNFPSEWELSVKPKLEWVAKYHPNVRITVIDQFMDLDPVEDCEDTWTLVERHAFGPISKQRHLDRLLQQRYKTHKNIASIAGNAPPSVLVLDNRWLSVIFSSEAASAANAKSDYLIDGTPRSVEYFYWSPALPELLREQGHIILDHLNANPADKRLFVKLNLNGSTTKHNLMDVNFREAQRELIKKLVYPNWNPATFQANKPTESYQYPEIYSWFYKHPESSQFLQSWKSAIDSQYSLIKSDFFTPNDPNKFTNFISKPYVIGRLTD